MKTILIAIIAISTIQARDWSIVSTYTIPEGASGLAFDGEHLYFGIYGVDGDHVYRFNRATGLSSLEFISNAIDDAFGLTYDGQNLWSIIQPGSSSQESFAVSLDSSGNQIEQIDLMEHYMSGIAYDGASFWVARYYPDPSRIYQVDINGNILYDFQAPDNQPWDISIMGDNLAIADYWGDSIYIVSKEGTLLSSYSSEGVDPAGVVWDGEHLWYCDNGTSYDNDILYKIDMYGDGFPSIDLSSETINFNDVVIGDISSQDLVVTNTGTSDLAINLLSFNNNMYFSSTDIPINLSPNESSVINISFQPTTIGTSSGTMTVFSNDPINPELNVSLHAYGIASGPEPDLEYYNIDLGDVRVGSHTSRKLNVINQGNDDLIITDIYFTNPSFYLDESFSLPDALATQESISIRYWLSQDYVSYIDSDMIIEYADIESSIVSLSANVIDFPNNLGSDFWSFMANDQGESITAIREFVDITDDGVNEILIADNEYNLHCINGNSSGIADIIWNVDYSLTGNGYGSIYSENGLDLGSDINGDTIPEIYTGTAWGSRSIFAIDGATGAILWDFDTDVYDDGGWIYEVDATIDFNNDGYTDILASSGGSGNNSGPLRVFLFNGYDGSVIWEKYFGVAMTAVRAFDDINNDNIPDVICASSPDYEDGYIYSLDGLTGLVINSLNTNSTAVWAITPINDADGDGYRDLAYGTFGGDIVSIGSVSFSEIWSVSTNGLILNFEAFSNYETEYLVSSTLDDNIPLIRTSDGSILWDNNVGGFVLDGSAIPDIDGDGFNEITVGTLEDDYMLYSGNSGNQIHSNSYYSPVEQTGSVQSIDTDDCPEIVVGLRNGAVYCFSGGSNCTSTYLEGDLNGDSIVNIQDIVITIAIITGQIIPTSDQMLAGDINSDGVIDILDIVLIINIILNNI